MKEDTLQETVSLITRSLADVRQSDRVKTDYGTEQVDLALYTRDLTSGIGLNWKTTNGLQFVGNAYADGNEFDEMKNLIVQTYQTLAVQKALKEVRYNVLPVETSARGARVVGVRA